MFSQSVTLVIHVVWPVTLLWGPSMVYLGTSWLGNALWLVSGRAFWSWDMCLVITRVQGSNPASAAVAVFACLLYTAWWNVNVLPGLVPHWCFIWGHLVGRDWDWRVLSWVLGLGSQLITALWRC